MYTFFCTQDSVKVMPIHINNNKNNIIDFSMPILMSNNKKYFIVQIFCIDC